MNQNTDTNIRYLHFVSSVIAEQMEVAKMHDRREDRRSLEIAGEKVQEVLTSYRRLVTLVETLTPPLNVGATRPAGIPAVVEIQVA